jgi:hypothetical protein
MNIYNQYVKHINKILVRILKNDLNNLSTEILKKNSVIQSIFLI